MAVRRRKRRMSALQRKYFGKGRKRSPVRKRRRSRRVRKNWMNTGMVSALAANPHRRRGRKRHHAVARRRHHYRRNPAFLGFHLPGVKTVIFAGVGFAGPSLLQGFLTQMAPTVVSQITSFGTIGKYAMKVGTVLGLTWITRRFVGSHEADMVLVGGGVNVAMSLVNDFAPGFLPANPLAMYVPTDGRLRGYVPTRGNLRAFPTPLHADNTNMMRPGLPTAAPFRNLSTSGPWGSASRYQRY